MCLNWALEWRIVLFINLVLPYAIVVSLIDSQYIDYSNLQQSKLALTENSLAVPALFCISEHA